MLKQSTSVLILGGGPAGLTLAWFLGRENIETHILEKSSEAGGLASSRRVGGYTFDRSGHLFHTTRRDILDWIRRRLHVKLDSIRRRSVCWVDGKFIPYPYQQNLFHLDADRIRDALRGYWVGRQSRPPVNFKEWIRSHYGAGIARLFMDPYNRKVWNMDLSKLDTDWVSRFLPSFDSAAILRSAFVEQKPDWGYNAVFYYPRRGGSGAIVKPLVDAAVDKMTLDASVCRIDLRRRRVWLTDGTEWSYERLVSTIPLPEFLSLSGISGSNLLRASGVAVFNVGVNTPSLVDFHWCYVPQKEIPFYRFGVYSNFSPTAAPRNHSSLYVECSARPNRLGRYSFDDVCRHLLRLRLIPSKKSVDVVERIDIPHAYPVPCIGLAQYRNRLRRHLRKYRVELIGRTGSWSYMSVADVMTEAIDLARRMSGR